MTLSHARPRYGGPINQIEFRDLDFDHVATTAYSTRGTPFVRPVAIGMPRIPPKILDNVCYLYKDAERAKIGAGFGGTAFLVAVPSSIPGKHYQYAVTNWHVAQKHGNSVIRVNTHSGEPDIFEYDPGQWFCDTRFDIAVCGIKLDGAIHRYTAMPIDGFALREHIEGNKVGPGDDVFMVGRFVDHDGGSVNKPAVRFGNISVMPLPIMQPNGTMADAYCIDLHSRTGYSGSPVYVYRTPGYDLEQTLSSDPNEQRLLYAGVNYLALLGIHFAQFPEDWEIADQMVGKPTADVDEAAVPLILEGKYIKGLSGMTCVLPAWSIWDVLHAAPLLQARIQSDERERARMKDVGESPAPVGE